MPQERLLYIEKKEHFWSLDKSLNKLPPVLNIQVWDNDLFGPNEFISKHKFIASFLIVSFNNAA